MKPLVSIIMRSTSDLPVMEKAFKFLDEMQIPFEVNALSAHRTPDAVEEFAKGAKDRGIQVLPFQSPHRYQINARERPCVPCACGQETIESRGLAPKNDAILTV